MIFSKIKLLHILQNKYIYLKLILLQNDANSYEENESILTMIETSIFSYHKSISFIDKYSTLVRFLYLVIIITESPNKIQV